MRTAASPGRSLHAQINDRGDSPESAENRRSCAFQMGANNCLAPVSVRAPHPSVGNRRKA